MPKQNWFNTLNEALNSENLIELWPFGRNISYGENVRIVVEDRLISIFRNDNGMYERPVHYKVK
jgi:hypothetical protein